MDSTIHINVVSQLTPVYLLVQHMVNRFRIILICYSQTGLPHVGGIPTNS